MTGTLCTSVVAKMNFTWGGGSSSVLRKALKAPTVSMCTSSTITTLKRSLCGRYGIDSWSRRTSSTPLFDAPSISSTSVSRPAVISTQIAHVPHGSGVGPDSQLSALASRRAVVVLPTPRTPVKRKACATRSELIAFLSVRVTCS